MILRLIDRVDEIKGVIIAIFGAFTGSALNAAEITTASGSSCVWFDTVSPILQTIAWSVAIVAGIVTTFKAFRTNANESKRKRHKH